MLANISSWRDNRIGDKVINVCRVSQLWWRIQRHHDPQDNDSTRWSTILSSLINIRLIEKEANVSLGSDVNITLKLKSEYPDPPSYEVWFYRSYESADKTKTIRHVIYWQWHHHHF